MNEFSGPVRPFVMGTLRGLRSFDVQDGKLHGVTNPQLFTPGENLAKCSSYYGRSGHQVASETCTCGFYAYFSKQANGYFGKGRVEAIIEAYGIVSIGPKGFRAEKARLAALVLPGAEGVQVHARKHPLWYDKASDFSAKANSAPGAAVAVGSWWTSFLALCAAAFISAGTALTVLFSAVAILAFFLGIAAIAVAKHGVDRRNDALSWPVRCKDMKYSTIDYDKVAANYSGVPVYGTLEQAIKEHPVTSKQVALRTDEPAA